MRKDNQSRIRVNSFSQRRYRAVNAIAIARGLDPDNPPYLKKVTETV